MPTKTRRTTLYFSDPFSLPGIEMVLPSGDYVIVEDEELIDGLSFVAYRRVGTFIEIPSATSKAHTKQMFPIVFADLENALWQDIAKMGPTARAVPAPDRPIIATGDGVRLADRSRVSPNAPEIFGIVFDVHVSGNAMIRYRIRNSEQDHERVESRAILVARDQPPSVPDPTKPETGDIKMAKGQKRGNREARKPKMVKSAVKAEASPVSVVRQATAGVAGHKLEKRK